MSTKKIQIIGSITPDLATDDKNGLMSATDKAKLDTVEKGAQVNVQPDWNQNDETKDDYIKNRTHYEIEKKNEVLVDNLTIDTFAKDGDNDWYVSADNPFEFDLTPENTYTVVFDGIEYECACEAHRRYGYDTTNTSVVKTVFGVWSIGNVQPLLSDAECAYTNLQFCVTWNYRRDANDSAVVNVFVYDSTNTAHTISIINTTSVFQRIPYEYMPNEIMGLKNGSGTHSVVLGYPRLANVASGAGAFAAGSRTVASGDYSKTEGAGTTAQGKFAHAEGFATIASGNYSHTEGDNTVASAIGSHAEGYGSTASGKYSHTEGQKAEASGAFSHAEGNKSIASGTGSHAEGQYAEASGTISHVEGEGTVANSRAQHVHGRYNIADTPETVEIGGKKCGKYIHIVGNGTAEDARSNAHTLDWSGNGWYAGNLRVGGTSYDDGSDIALKSEVDDSKTYTDTVASGKADKAQGVLYIEGGGTTDTTNKVATWTGSHPDITEYYPGLMLAYKIGTAGSTTTTLNINNLGEVTVVKNASSAISTNFAVNSVIFLVYTVDDTTAYWKAHDYDANTRNSVGDYRKNDTKLYFVGTTTSDASTSSSYATSYTNSNIYVTKSNVLYSTQGFEGKLKGNADTATSATKATQDASGNVITSTYETKTDASTKLTEAKTYTDTEVAKKVPTSRTVNGKALTSNITLSASDVNAYSKAEIDNLELITVDDIDAICGITIEIASASEVTF